MTKLQRILLACLLGITKEKMIEAKQIKPYATVLAVNKSRLDLLTHIARSGIATPSNLREDQLNIYKLDTKASNIYASLSNTPGNKDLTTPLQKV